MAKPETSPDLTKWTARIDNTYWVAFKLAFPEIDFSVSRELGRRAEVPKELLYERADLIARVKQLVTCWENVMASGVTPFGPEKDLARLWPEHVIVETYKVGLILSDKRQLRRLSGYSSRNSRPRTRTPDLAAEARELYSERYTRVKAAAKDYTRHKRSGAWAKHVAIDDKKRTGKPKLPQSIIIGLPFKPARELALRWTADELNQLHSGLGATPYSVRGLLNTAVKADTSIN